MTLGLTATVTPLKKAALVAAGDEDLAAALAAGPTQSGNQSLIDLGFGLQPVVLGNVIDPITGEERAPQEGDVASALDILDVDSTIIGTVLVSLGKRQDSVASVKVSAKVYRQG
jgi:hypothetical protein